LDRNSWRLYFVVGVFLVALNKIDAKGLIYILLNLIGAVVAGFASYFLNYWPFIILQGAWTAVSVYSLIDYFKTRKNPSTSI